MSEQTRKTPGAQPGNTNALKHGFYSKRAAELLAEGETTAEPNLENEIKMLRRVIHRCFEQIENSESPRTESLLNALGAAVTRLGTLLKTQKLLTGGKDAKDEMDDMLQQALRELLEEPPDDQPAE
jgi:hypothetical protein